MKGEVERAGRRAAVIAACNQVEGSLSRWLFLATARAVRFWEER